MDLRLDTLRSEDVLHILGAVAYLSLHLRDPSFPGALGATTMDRSLPRLIPHMAEARGGQGRLVAGAFSIAITK
uniref:Uncharacterized protein n=1 Tax=Knipowitschia caucasica TaxID=637954 RepID=A0AAV2KBY6_KNICA